MSLSNLRYIHHGILIIMICSCASIDTNRVAPGYIEAFNSIKNYVTGFENVIEPEIIKNIPYASIIVKIGKGPEALMNLQNISKNQIFRLENYYLI